MKKKIILFIICFLILISHLFLPLLSFKLEDKIIVFRYNDDFSEFETNSCYSESYSYNEKWDVSIYNWDVQKIAFGFYMISLSYDEGNVCRFEYVLEEEYIGKFLLETEIEYNDKNIDIANLIRDKEAIVGNTKYFGNDYDTAIYYVLEGRHEVMYIFYVDDLLVFQVGNSDEGPRFIAYK